MRTFCILAALLLAPAASASEKCLALHAPYAAQAHDADLLHLPTPASVLAEMLRLAKVTPADVVYDLGSGDGRIPITAAKEYGARGVGIEIDWIRIREANDNLKKAGVGDRVMFVKQDLFEANISGATVVTLFLMTRINQELMPKLKR